jgi:hypothetical protein
LCASMSISHSTKSLNAEWLCTHAWLQVYSSVNLVLAVPYKAIMDVRAYWFERFPKLGPPKVR